MMLRNKVFIATGAFIIIYYVVKYFMSDSGKTSKKIDKTVNESEEVTEEETGENTAESAQLKTAIVADTQTMKGLRLKPNFFIAFPVNNVGIHKRVKKLQEQLMARSPSMFPALVRVSTLHVTLAVTHLANEAEIQTVKNKLDEWAEKNIEVFFKQPCVVSFTGVKTFNNIVAYVNIVQCSNYEKILKLSHEINNLLSSAGFTVDKRSFKPHLTFVKLSKDLKLLKLKKNFKSDFDFLKDCREHFGKQEITCIELLSMDDPKTETGYYKSYHEINLTDAKPDMDHSECCTPVPKPKSLAKKENIKYVLEKLK